MNLQFKHEYLQRLYETGRDDKKHRYQPQVINGYRKALDALLSASQMEELFTRPFLHYEHLHGDKEGLSSVRANGKYRVEFEERTENGETVISICYITDLSKHYQ